jgi:hypothetical protein
MIKLTISILSLFAPLVWESFDDSKGDHNKAQDVFLRCMIGLVAALVNFFLIGKPILDSFILSMAIHFMFFDYLINIILYKNDVIDYANWFSHTGKKGVIDNVPFWKNMNPWTKLYVRVGVLIAAIVIYAI